MRKLFMRKRFIFVLIIAGFVFSLIVALILISRTSTTPTPKYVPNQLLVATGGVETDLRLQEINVLCGTKIDQQLMVTDRGTIYLLEIIDGGSVEDAVRCWKQFSEIDSAQPNYINELDREPMLK